MRRLPPPPPPPPLRNFPLLLLLRPHLLPPRRLPPSPTVAITVSTTQHRTFRQPKTSQTPTRPSSPSPSPSSSLLPRISRTTTPPIAPPTQRRQKPGTSNTLLRFKITLAPPGVSRKVLELVKRASASKHLIRGTASVISFLSTLPASSSATATAGGAAGDGGGNGDVGVGVGPVVLALSGGGASVVGHVPVILECNRLGIPWVYVPASSPAGEEGEGDGGGGGGGGGKGVVGRTGVGTVMVVPWVAGARAGGEVMHVGEGSRAVAKEFNFRDARRVVLGLLAGARDLDLDLDYGEEEEEEEGGE